MGGAACDPLTSSHIRIYSLMLRHAKIVNFAIYFEILTIGHFEKCTFGKYGRTLEKCVLEIRSTPEESARVRARVCNACFYEHLCAS